MQSFIFVGVYWNNHHHMLHAVEHVTGGNLWANLHLLFWPSLVPFLTGWMGENNFAPLPVAIYGGVLLCAAFAYTILQLSLIRTERRDSALAQAMGRGWKGKASLVIYLGTIAVALWEPLLACARYVAVAILWLVPDRRIERNLPAR